MFFDINIIAQLIKKINCAILCQVLYLKCVMNNNLLPFSDDCFFKMPNFDFVYQFIECGLTKYNFAYIILDINQYFAKNFLFGC